MLKRRIAALVALIMIAASILPSVSASEIQWMIIPANYIYWAKFFFGTEVDSETKGPTRDSDDNTVMQVDKLTTYNDRSSFALVKASVAYFDTNEQYTESSANAIYSRVLSFYLAIEYGKPMELSTEEATSAVRKAMDFFSQLPDSKNPKYDDVLKGDYVEFCATEKGRYCLHLDYGTIYTIYFFPAE